VELVAMDVKTRKTTTMHVVFHIKSDVDRLYVKRKDGGRGLISVADCVRMKEENLQKYVTKSEKWMLQKVLQECVVIGSVPRVHRFMYQRLRFHRLLEPTRPTYKAKTVKEQTDLWRSHCIRGFSKVWGIRTLEVNQLQVQDIGIGWRLST